MTSLFRISLFQIAKCSIRKYSTEHVIKRSLVHLKDRSIIMLYGDETPDFLQGLITNDIRHLQEGAANIFCLFLNIKGRVIFDSIIYKAQEPNKFFLECDTRVMDNLLKHLKMYKLKRQIDIQSYQSKMHVWAVFNDNILQETINATDQLPKFEETVFPCGATDNKSVKQIDENIFIFNDPRLQEMGSRILCKTELTSNEIIKNLEPNVSLQSSENYKAFRYKLGIGEGSTDLPPNNPFPLEINADYLHGVSFHKGCYIGQELTARTYHTGVVRKRLMPLIINSDKSFDYDEKVVNENDKVVGKLRGKEGHYGLGLMRISEALNSKILMVKDVPIKLTKPFWWPQETQKAEASVKTNK